MRYVVAASVTLLIFVLAGRADAADITWPFDVGNSATTITNSAETAKLILNPILAPQQTGASSGKLLLNVITATNSAASAKLLVNAIVIPGRAAGAVHTSPLTHFR